MYSGKSEALIRRLRRAEIAKRSVTVFKPSLDTRYSAEHTVSHTGQKFQAIGVPADDPEWILRTWIQFSRSGLPLLDWSWDADVIGIDEVQFFGPAIVNGVRTLVDAGKRVIVAGLDLTYRAEPFGSLPTLLALADRVDKLTAVCTICGNPATRSHRLVASKDTVLVGEKDSYDARCHVHFSLPEE
jgi:thymidine kinase